MMTMAHQQPSTTWDSASSGSHNTCVITRQYAIPVVRHRSTTMRVIIWFTTASALFMCCLPGALADVIDALDKRFEDAIPTDVPTLVIQNRARNSNGERLCNGFPAIVLNTDRFESNKACFSANATTTKRLSCTCLTSYTAQVDKWEFRLSAATTETMASPLPPSLEGEKVYNVDALLILTIPDTIKTIQFLGQDVATTLKVTLLQLALESTHMYPALVDDAPLLENIVVDAIDLSRVTIHKEFVPRTLQTLVLNMCKLQSLSMTFLESIPFLHSLVLSSNQLTEFTPYVQSLFNLTTLSLSNNKIANYSVSYDVYEKVKQYTAFELDPPPATMPCPYEWIAVGTTKLCVAPNSNKGGGSHGGDGGKVDTQPPSSSSSSSSLPLTAILGGVCGLLVVALVIVVCLRRRRSRKQPRASKEHAMMPLPSSTTTPLKTLSYNQFTDTHDSDSDGDRISDLTTPSMAMLDHPTVQAHFIDQTRIHISKCISSGGFGVVYNGRLDQRRVAIKSLLPHLAIDAHAVKLFVSEITLVASLRHPRIVEFLGVSLDTGRNLCTIMELMEEGNLHDVLQRYKHDSERMTWSTHKPLIALQIAEALVFLHSRSPTVIHRDLKSANVLLTSILDAKLTDFGISRVRKADAHSYLTAAIGTTQWMAPEVLMGEQYDESADVFSFGVVLAEIDTDDYPTWQPRTSDKTWEEDTTTATESTVSINHHTNHQNLILRMAAAGHMRPSLTAQCPREIANLVDQCVQTEPRRRPRIAEVVTILQRFQEHMTVE